MPRSVDLVQFINEDEPEYDWIIPGFLERHDRLILTGWEGHGKSTLSRQIAVQAHLGVHPFTHEAVDPITVLYIDLENSERFTRREFQKIQTMCGRDFKPEWIQVISSPEGLDLLNKQDDTYLQAEIAKVHPELVIIGPLYKLSGGNPVAETDALPVAKRLDALRMMYGFAIIIEAHPPYAQGDSKRPTRPYGWSGWSRWPELGLWIHKDGDFERWREDRDPRPDIPKKLQRGKIWPWEPNDRDPFSNACAFAQALGRLPSQREVADYLGISKGAAQRMLERNRDAWNSLL